MTAVYDGDDAGSVLEVDAELCVGSTLCTQLAPGVFALGEDGRATTVGDPRKWPDLVQEAEDNCPTAAIRYRPQSR